MEINKKWINQRRAELMLKTSDAEKSAYRLLISINLRVIRQYPVMTGRKIYFADLYLPDYHLILEIDGGYHDTKNQRRLDGNRSQGLWRRGYHVCRLTNHDARSMEKLRLKIRRYTALK